jgi:predicted ribonuclease YlaK
MASNKRNTAVSRRADLTNQEPRQLQHQPKTSNALKIKIDHLRSLDPLTTNQSRFFDIYDSGEYFMFLLGSPGTGKTFVSMGKALEEVLQKDNPYKELIVVRSTVQTRDVGFLPGDLAQKSELFELPYKEICANLFGRSDAWERLKEQSLARFITTTAIRGISLDNAIIIVDEIQNF